MTKMLVLYYSSYGHIEAMAKAVANGAKQAGAAVALKRVPNSCRRRSLGVQDTGLARKCPSQPLPSLPTMMQSSSARRLASATWRAK